ncbi:MAG: type II secretion system F family protein [Proteobacteria bacterium]|nr:type II secretion system F family protein [Pseudomonadota bacterium]NOG58878.1 type II secretion system F family protein [Pseudomonadota bacterium]
MPNYFYKVVTNNGETLEGEIEAPSQSTAIEKLQNSGYIPISAEEASASRKTSNFSFSFTLPGKGKINSNHISIMTRELATLLHAGLPLDQALQTLERVSTDSSVKTLVNNIYTQVQGGASLSVAMEAQQEGFSRLYLNMIRAGEAGGALEIVLQKLSDYLERSSEMRSTIISALIYPSILLVIAILSVIALMIFVVPQFVPLFEDVGQALPLSTQIVFGMAEIFQQYWWLFPILVVSLLWFFQNSLKDPVKHFQWDNFLLSLPLFGDLIAKIEVSRFSRTLGTLLNNGVPLLTGVSIVKEVISNRAISDVMETVITSLEQGGRLAEALNKAQQFPQLAVQLIQVGEETGQLDIMLLKIADIYDQESNAAIKRLLTLIEPVLILGLGGMIAIIIISILVAILGLNELVI